MQTQPNICIISEEVEAKGQTLNDIVDYIAGIVAARAADGNNFGTVLIPEGLIEFIPAMKKLIAELNDFLAVNGDEFAKVPQNEQISFIASKLSKENAAIYTSLPEGVARQLSLDRDPHGNVQVSLIETEKLLSEMVGRRLAEMKKEGKYVGKFSPQHHFFGYEGRCAAPSNFDADYCYSLGYNAAMLIGSGKTGYMSSIRNTTAPADEWIAGGIPVTMMMNMVSGLKRPLTFIRARSNTSARRRFATSLPRLLNWNIFNILVIFISAGQCGVLGRTALLLLSPFGFIGCLVSFILWIR